MGDENQRGGVVSASGAEVAAARASGGPGVVNRPSARSAQSIPEQHAGPAQPAQAFPAQPAPAAEAGGDHGAAGDEHVWQLVEVADDESGEVREYRCASCDEVWFD